MHYKYEEQFYFENGQNIEMLGILIQSAKE